MSGRDTNGGERATFFSARSLAPWIACGGAVLAYAALVCWIPPYWRGKSPHDDLWVVQAAERLAAGKWLGGYGPNTLIKGCFAPMMVAFAHVVGLSFMALNAVLHVCASAFFAWTLARFCALRWMAFAVFAVLLFNPLSYALYTWQRLYRNGLPIWQVPLVVGCLFLVYRNRGERWWRVALPGGVAGIVLWMLVNTREDGLWIWPFVLTCLLVSALLAFFEAGRQRPSRRLARLTLFVIPVAMVVLGNFGLALLNRVAYGVALRNDRCSGNYAKVMRQLYLIRPDSVDDAKYRAPEYDGQYYNIYASTVEKAFAASPTFASAAAGIRKAFRRWDAIDALKDGLPWADHPLFAIRDGVASAGYYKTLATSEAFYAKVGRELDAAFADGRLQRRGVAFSAMAAPLSDRYIGRLLPVYGQTLGTVILFRDVRTGLRRPEGPEQNILRFERMGGSLAPRAAQLGQFRRPVERANLVTRAYSWLAPALFAISLLIYISLSVGVMRSRFVSGVQRDAWLLASGLLASLLLLTACVSYVSATTFPATNHGYLAAAYLLDLMFCCTMLAVCPCLISRVRFWYDFVVKSRGRGGVTC